MADIVPFRGWRYDPALVQDMGRVISPPYDVIGRVQRRRLFDASPYNIARIITAEPDAAAPEGEQYHDAGERLRDWLEAGVLKQDDRPAIYVYEQEFDLAGERRSRTGMIALVRLEAFGKGVVPHERTLSGPKADRLNLLRATRAQFGQIFTVYSDPEQTVEGRLDAARSQEPLVDVTDGGGMAHRLWAISDEPAVHAIQQVISERDLFIADGHHRHETAHNYRDENPRCEAANYRMMTLVNMSSGGLVILPIHRLVKNVTDFRAGRLLEALHRDFEITALAGAGAEARERMSACMRDAAAAGRAAFGLYVNDGSCYAMALREDVALEGWSEVQKRVDVNILQELILDPILGIDSERLASGTHVEYVNDVSPLAVPDAVAKVEAGDCQALFFVNSTPAEVVAAVARAGEKMAQKSTFFYPKVYTGLVINKLDA